MRQPQSLRWVGTPALLAILIGTPQVFATSAHSDRQDAVAEARRLATTGHRAEALGLLKARLAESPDDTDARVLYGTVLSWEGRYDEAREQLAQVLVKTPGHGDALPALINLELWSDHPDRARQLAEQALEHQPNEPAMLLFKARALRALGQSRAAQRALEHLLTVDPTNQQARRMRKGLQEDSRKWELSFDHFYDRFRGGPEPQHELWASLKHVWPRISVTARFERAYRFSFVSQQFEIDAYPKFRPGTYAYVNIGYSPDAVLYPRNRFGVDLYQSLGRGFEGSLGYRHMTFSSKVNIYTAALAKYRGDWLFTGRAFLTPDSLGVSRTFVISARRLFGETGLYDYLDFRISTGASLEQIRTTQEIQVLDSTGFFGEFNKTLGTRWAVAFKSGWSREDRLQLSGVQRIFLRSSLYFRF